MLADGYKIDGAHFCIEIGAQVPGCVSPLSGPLDITMQPNPLPDSTIRAQVFEDNAPTNGGPDATEANLAGFVGHIKDVLGEIQTDVYGNPLCTTYEGENPDTYEIPLSALDADMLPDPDAGNRWQLRERRERHAGDPAPRDEPLQRRRHPARRARSGSRRPPSRATTTGTRG